jgi:hypothetical protein
VSELKKALEQERERAQALAREKAAAMAASASEPKPSDAPSRKRGGAAPARAPERPDALLPAILLPRWNASRP